MKRSTLLIAVLSLAVCLASAAVITAQTTPTTPTTGGQNLDVNAILQALGLGGNLLDTGTGTGTGTGTDTGTGTPTTQPSGPTETPPSIVENQFTTTGSAALQARAPGLFIQHARAVQDGSVTLTGDAVDDPGFAETLTTDISNVVLNTWSGIFSSINTFLGALGGFGGVDSGGTGTTGTIPNAATSGQGTTTPISRVLPN
jgi:hypothetical protein